MTVLHVKRDIYSLHGYEQIKLIEKNHMTDCNNGID